MTISARIGMSVPVPCDYTGRPSRLSNGNSGKDKLRQMAATSTAIRTQRADARRNRARVLKAAIAAFAAEGLSVPVHEIARRAGVGTGTVSRHFPTKEALYIAIIRDRIENVVQQARTAAASKDPGTAFLDFFALMVNQFAENLALSDALAGAGFDMHTVASGTKLDVMGALRDLLSRAQEAGAVRTDLEVDDVKALMIACCRGPQAADAHARRRMIAVISQGLRPQDKTVRRVRPVRSR